MHPWDREGVTRLVNESRSGYCSSEPPPSQQRPRCIVHQLLSWSQCRTGAVVLSVEQRRRLVRHFAVVRWAGLTLRRRTSDSRGVQRAYNDTARGIEGYGLEQERQSEWAERAAKVAILPSSISLLRARSGEHGSRREWGRVWKRVDVESSRGGDCSMIQEAANAQGGRPFDKRARELTMTRSMAQRVCDIAGHPMPHVSSSLNRNRSNAGDAGRPRAASTRSAR